ncbi:hypothetical protein B0H12DRAFT_1074078 [Mycena haematopus]|nr:hypothetical protein B0H12DRAFT_1074078 [Mycena haematopus]
MSSASGARDFRPPGPRGGICNSGVGVGGATVTVGAATVLTELRRIRVDDSAHMVLSPRASTAGSTASASSARAGIALVSEGQHDALDGPHGTLSPRRGGVREREGGRTAKEGEEGGTRGERWRRQQRRNWGEGKHGRGGNTGERQWWGESDICAELDHSTFSLSIDSNAASASASTSAYVHPSNASRPSTTDTPPKTHPERLRDVDRLSRAANRGRVEENLVAEEVVDEEGEEVFSSSHSPASPPHHTLRASYHPREAQGDARLGGRSSSPHRPREEVRLSLYDGAIRALEGHKERPPCGGPEVGGTSLRMKYTVLADVSSRLSSGERERVEANLASLECNGACSGADYISENSGLRDDAADGAPWTSRVSDDENDAPCTPHELFG